MKSTSKSHKKMSDLTYNSPVKIVVILFCFVHAR